MSSVVWKTGTSGTWTTAADWAGGVAPTATDDVTISVAPTTSGVPYIVDLATSESVHSVVLNQALAELRIDYYTTLTVSTTFALTAGSLDLEYGTLFGGTYTSTAGTVLVDGSGTLSNLSWNGNLNLEAGPDYGYGYLYLDAVNFHGSAGTGSGIMTVGAGVDVYVEQALLNNDAASLSNGATLNAYSGSLTLGSAFTLSTSGSSISGTYSPPADLVAGTSLINQGNITDKSGATLDIQAGTFSNAGTITVGAGSSIVITSSGTTGMANTGLISVGSGGYLELAPAGTSGFTNSGTVAVTGGTLALDFALTTAKLLTYAVTSGTISLLGTLANTSTTLTLGSGGKIANLLLNGGEIYGGTIVTNGDFTVAGSTSTASTLSNVTFDGLLSLGVSGVEYYDTYIDIENTLHLSGATGTGLGTISIGNNTDIDFTVTQSLANAAVDFGSTAGTTSTQSTITAGIYGEAAATTFTLGAGLTLTQGATSAYISPATQNDLTINAGTINAGIAGGQFVGDNVKNTGAISITNGGNFTWENNSSLVTTLANTGKITISDGSLSIAANTLLNSGTVSLSGTNSLVNSNIYYNNGVSIDNSGSVLLSNGATLALGSNGASWTNTGTIQVNASELSLGGTFTTAQIGSIVITNGGKLAIGGTLTNSGTLSVGTSKTLSSVVLLSGGEIAGGVIADAGNGIAGQGGTLSGVAYHGVLNLSASLSSLDIANGLVMTGASGSGLGTILATGSGGTLNLSSSQTISGALIDVGTSVASANNQIDFQDISGADTLTLAAGDSLVQTGTRDYIEGNVAYLGANGYQPTGDTLINKGSITETVAGSLLSMYSIAFTNGGSMSIAGGSELLLYGTTLTNSGSLSLSGTNTAIVFGYDYNASGFANTGVLTIGSGASVNLDQGTTWSNTGTIKDAGGTLTLGGTFTSAALGTVQVTAGGIVNLYGILQNTGTLSVGTGAALATLTFVNGGEISGGTIKDAGGGIAGSGGTLSGITYFGSLALTASSAQLTITDGLTMAGTAGTGTGTITDTAPNANLLLLGTETLAGAVIDFGTSPSNGYAYFSGLGVQDLPSSVSTITLSASSSLVQTGLDGHISGSSAYLGGVYGPSGDTIVNDGSITETFANAYLIDLDLDIINAGKMSIGNGAELLVQSGTLSNKSTLAIATASTTNFAQAELVFAEGGYAGSEGFTNTGLVTIGVGGLLNLTDPDLTWSNNGTFQVSGGELLLGGTFTTAQLGTLLVSGGGTVGIAGTLTNGGTLSVGTGTSLPALTLFSAGVISGGTIADAGGGIIVDGGTLSAVTYQGTLNVPSGNGELTLLGGLSMTGTGGSGAGTLLLNGPGSEVYVAGSQTISGAVIDFGNADDSTLYLTELQGSLTTLTLAASTSVVQTGLYAAISGSLTYTSQGEVPRGDAVINDGSITNTLAGSSLQLDEINMINAGHITIGSGGTVVMNEGALKNSSTILISGTGTSAAGYVYDSRLSFAADGVAAPGFANSGLVSIGAGGQLELDDASATLPLVWSNTGSIAVAGGLLGLGGSFTTAQLGKITVSAGGDISINADGTLNNTGATLTIGGTATLGTIALQGTILGGTILDDGNGFVFEHGVNPQTEQGTTAELDDVKYEGTLGITNAFEDLLVTGGISLTGTAGTGTGAIMLTGEGAVLDFIGAQKLALSTVSIGAASDGATLTGNALILSNSINQVGADATLGSVGSTITSGSHIVGAQNGGTLTLAGNFANTGTIAISNGETLLLDTSNLTNTGVISVTNGVLDAVTATTSQLSELTLTNSPLAVTGTLTGTGSTLTVGTGTTLPFIELSGTILGGTIHDAGGGIGFYGDAFLDGVTYQGTLSLSRPLAAVTILGGLTANDLTGKLAGSISVTGAGSQFIWGSTQALNNATISIGNAGTSYEGQTIGAPVLTGIYNIGSVSLGAQLTINQTNTYADIGGENEGYDYLDTQYGSFISAATINANFASGQLGLIGYSFDSTGTIAISNGDIVTADAADFTNAGKITIGTGSTLALNLYAYFADNNVAPESFTNSGSISLAGGTLTELTDAGTFPSVPLLNNTGAHITGYGSIQSAIVNDGTITAQGGILTLGQTTTGAGALVVSAGATLVLSRVSNGETAGFSGASGLLSLAPPSFLGKIGAFVSGDTIDLQNTTATAAHFTTTSLVVTLSSGSTISLATASALTGSLTVTAGTHGDSLISFTGAEAKTLIGSPGTTEDNQGGSTMGAIPSATENTPLGVAWHSS